MRCYMLAVIVLLGAEALAQSRNPYTPVTAGVPPSDSPNSMSATTPATSPPRSPAPPPPTADLQALPNSGLSAELGVAPLSGNALDSRPPFTPNAAAPLSSRPAAPVGNTGVNSPPATSLPSNTNSGNSNSGPQFNSVPAASPPPNTDAYTNRSGGVLDAGNTASNDRATEIMTNALRPATGSQLTGTRVGLAEVVAGATTRAEQTRRIELYWDLCASVADYNLSLHELEDLNRLAARVGSQDRAIASAVNVLRGRIETSRRGAVAGQMRLAEAMNIGALPLPGDLPHVGAYKTKYGEIFGTRASGEAAELNALIPLRHAELMAAAEGVIEAEDWLEQVATSPQASQGAAGVVQALKLLALNRRAFVQVARDYNRRITRYTELATPGQVSTTRLVAMLIKNSAAATASRPAPPATGRPLYGPQSQSDGPPATFRGEWETPSLTDSNPLRDERVAPASVDMSPQDERSIVTERRMLPSR